ncbi:hypothetical protein GCM10009122_39080 [Fulvivirga kasyanovii]|uniref:hypothetical protein n=2 Tax=Fulvivirga kasyanovii TaxID=396812 RepID=UPI0031DE33B9
METIKKKGQMEIWHEQFNLDGKDNLEELPNEKAVFGVFGIVNDEPINCRFIGESENLRDTVKTLFEAPPSEGMKKFMQGPWIQMIKYDLLPESGDQERKKAVDEWTTKYHPKIDDNGEYPGYYD